MLSGDQGRLRVADYEEFSNSKLAKNLLDWHEYASAYRYDFKSGAHIICDATLEKMATYICGSVQTNEKTGTSKLTTGTENAAKDACKRVLLNCKVNGQMLPYSYLLKIIENTVSSKSKLSDTEWHDVLHVACCLINKYKHDNKEEYTLALDKENRNHSYLFGRLFAVLQYMETEGRTAATKSSGTSKEKTSSISYMLRGCMIAPASQAMNLWSKAELWLNKCSTGKRVYVERMYNELMEQFDPKGWTNAPVDHNFMLGFAHQDKYIFTSHKTVEDAVDTAVAQASEEGTTVDVDSILDAAIETADSASGTIIAASTYGEQITM